MNVFPIRSFPYIFCALFVSVSVTLHAQTHPVPPSQTPGAKPGPSKTAPKYTEEQMQEMISKLEDRIQKAAEAVLGRIRKEETDVHLRFSYLRKPERLDPNYFKSKEDITIWRDSLKELKDKEIGLDKLYAEADQDLGNALIQQRINQSIADQIKNELLKSFPWNIIKKKSDLMREYIAEHDDLLAFYDKNWGSWKPGSEPGTATFSDNQLATTFQSLKEKINATGKQIDEQYKVMLE
ncbi:MAG: hypothetical protein JO066_05620 [Verrucomicrobia bacterium]|nr:hypothetical protein [Verrucomicrobiota bacterium]